MPARRQPGAPDRLTRVPVAPGVSLTAELEGPADGRPVLLLHGGGQTRHAWGGTRAALAAAGWRAIAVDLRGHGDSDWSPDGDYSPPVFAADVKALIEWAGGHPALVGAS